MNQQQRAVVQQALEALEGHGTPFLHHKTQYASATAALRQLIEAGQRPEADKAFEKWWDEEGSTAPKHRLDCEEHCYQIAKIAWSNGAYKAREADTTLQAQPAAWVELSERDLNELACGGLWPERKRIALAVAAKLREKNGGAA
jgi:hypothetical protein